jgi:hypothetical protein
VSHFRTLTAVVEIKDDSELRYPGYAMERARMALEATGFTNPRVRNAPNPTGDMPPHRTEDESR